MNQQLFRSMLLATALLPAIAGPAAVRAQAESDTASDAAYIVQQTVSEEMFAASLQTLAPVLSSAIENDLRQQGIEVSDVDTFSSIIFEEFLAGFTEEMQRVTIAKYQELFNARQLSEIAAFYRSDTGQALLSKSTALMNFGAEQGKRIGSMAAQEARYRIATRLQNEGIEITKPGQMDELIEALK